MKLCVLMVNLMALLVVSGLVEAKVTYSVKEAEMGFEPYELTDVEIVTDEILMTGPMGGLHDDHDGVLMTSDATSEHDVVDPLPQDDREPMVEDSKLIEDVIKNSAWVIDADDEKSSDSDDFALITDDTDYDEIIKAKKWTFQSKAFADYYNRMEE